SPLLTVHEETMERLKYALTNMPAGMVIVNSLIFTTIYIITTYLAYEPFYVAYGIGPFYTAAGILLGLPSFTIGGVIFYYSFRQLVLVNRIVRMAGQFDLFQLDPVYAFSRLTSQTAIAWVIMLSLTLVLFPLELATGPILLMIFGQVALAAAAFALPLWVVHQRLVAEKRGLLADVNRRVVAMLSRLHQDLDNKEFGEVSGLNNALSGLIVERDLIGKCPTWPWRAGTLTGVLTAIFLPILLFLIQVVLGNLLGE
ncbi:MAG: hypothetical protein R3335_15605, partial [Anaerolineales bacterium]|nr:hypothetical protein [Anaerolineales bacterium]